MIEDTRRYLQWWMLPGAVTLLLVAYNSPWVRLYYDDFYHWKQWVFGLRTEMNFGAWWSSTICLLAWFIGLVLWHRRDRRLLWLLALPLAMVIRLELDHVASTDLAAGPFACLCALALIRSDSWARRNGSIESAPGQSTSPEENRWTI